MAKILIIEDNRDLVTMIRSFLIFEHHTVECIYSGAEAASHLGCYSYDVIILDWSLPEKSGLEVLKEFRAGGGNTPVLMLSEKDSLAEKETGLDSGADDYLIKPFNLKELAARVRALLRRPAKLGDNVLTAGDLCLDPKSYRVVKAGRPVELLPGEFALLEFMMRHPNQVFSAEALLERVWKSDSEATAEAVRTVMKRLRKKIESEDSSAIIRTFRGVGYILEERPLEDNYLDVNCSLSEEGVFVRVNSAALRAWGYQPDELLGKQLADFVVPDDRRLTTRALSNVKISRSSAIFENRMIHKNHNDVYTLWSIRWSENDHAVLCVARDISQQYEVQRSHQAFVSMVSHKLKTPLTSVQDFLTLLEGGALGNISKDAMDKLAVALRSVDHINKLINDLLDLEKAESGKPSARELDIDVK